MKQYQKLLSEVLRTGVKRINRTNKTDIFIPSAMMKFDLREGFPAVTTKQLFYKQSIGEIIGFIRGYENAADFRTLGCKIWNSDANENKVWLASPYRQGEDDLGKIYGSTWRSRTIYKTDPIITDKQYLETQGYHHVANNNGIRVYCKTVDQLREIVNTIINSPNDRRIIMHAWFPELFDEMALPPCHCLYRFIPDSKNKILHMSMYQRSCDLFLGVPFNIFGSALLLSLVAHATGYTPGIFTHHLDDVHLYENAIRQSVLQITREPLKLPELMIKKSVDIVESASAMTWLETINPSDINIENYEYHEPLRVEMAQDK